MFSALDLKVNVLSLAYTNSNNMSDIDIGVEDVTFEEIGGSGKEIEKFGGGLDLLMNTSLKNNSSSKSDADSDVDLAEIRQLSNSLNDDDDNEVSGMSSRKRSSLFSAEPMEEVKLNIGDAPIASETIKLVEDDGQNKTWDGFQKMDNVPNEADKAVLEPKPKREELLREKFVYLRKLEELEQKGVRLTKHYSMDSSLDEMKGEYEMIISEKEKSNSVKFQGKMLMACITGLEFLNNKFDPFDLKLDGWGEQVNENINDYDEIFGELHEKYHSKAKMAPELKLMFQLAGSAIMLHMTNSMFKSSMPNVDDYMRQHPEVMKEFTKAAVSSMGDNNPGFGGFMNSVMGSGSAPQRSEPAPSMMGPPPPAMQTKAPHPGRAGGMTNNNQPSRPDLDMARGEPQRSQRSEMKGPSDISSILEGLKKREPAPSTTKRVNITAPQEDGSTISAQDAGELSGSRVPKTRRKKSERNTISLDI
jgi:hypothetical protein